DQVGADGGDLGQRQPLGAADDRHHETLGRGDGDADVRTRVAEKRFVREGDVDLGVTLERGRTDLRKEIGDADLHLGMALARAGSGSSALGFSGSAETLPFPDTSGTDSPGSPMKAIVVPTGTSPSGTAILSSTPAASASTSCVTFSVSSS